MKTIETHRVKVLKPDGTELCTISQPTRRAARQCASDLVAAAEYAAKEKAMRRALAYAVKAKEKAMRRGAPFAGRDAAGWNWVIEDCRARLNARMDSL